MPESRAFNEDCLAAMREMPDKCFNLAVVDPPYGIGVGTLGYTQGAKRVGKAKATRRDYRVEKDWDTKPTQEYFDQLFRISEKCIIWGGNYFADMLPPSKGFICWDKRVADAMTNDFADCEYAYLSPGLGVARVFRFVWNGMLQQNMSNKEDRIHPCQKPVQLYQWIFKNYAKPGYKILDTHLGSGSSRIAAWDAGLDFTGYEIDKKYFDQQEARFQKHISQNNLFLMEEQNECKTGTQETLL